MTVTARTVAGARDAERDEFVHIATAALALTDKIAAARAARIIELERVLMFDADRAYRAKAKAEYLMLTDGRSAG